MLHYLVTYVRGSLERESPLVIRPAGVSPATHHEPVASATAAEPALLPRKIERQDHGVVRAIVLLAAAPQPAAPGSDIPAPVRRGGATALLLFLTLALLPALSGCACFRREKVDANVVSARQLSLRGMDALQRGQWEDAEKHFAGALEKNPSDERAHRHFAEVLWHQGDHDAAIRHQEKSVRLSGGDPSLLVQLGEMYVQRGNIDAASECADEAIEGNRQLSGAWALRGDIQRQRGQLEVAMQCYHRALSYQPHYPHVQMSLAAMYGQSGRSQRALATLSALASQYPPDQVPLEVDFQRGLALKALGRHQDAVETLAAAAGRSEPTADLLYHLSEAQYLAGNTANSRLALQAALSKVPNHSDGLKLRDKLERNSPTMTAVIER